jgi:hypothetical protein
VVGGWPISGSGGVPVSGLGPVGPQPIFFAPLTNTLVPTTAGNPAFTFTRATLAYAMGFEGVLRQGISNEARFQGARRVRNLLAGNSTTMTGPGWTVNGATLTPGALGPTGLSDANTLTVVSASPAVYGSITLAASATIASSIWIRRRTGTGTVQMVGHAAGASITITPLVDGTWRRFAITSLDSAVAIYVGVQLATVGDQIDVAYAQFEQVDGQSNQAPGEYVSVGVLAPPYHGNAVDGVQYYPTYNGNRVQGINLVVQSQDFADPLWVKQTMAVVANSTVAPDGTLTGDTVTATASSAFLTQLVNGSGGSPMTFSIWLKRLTGTGAINLTDGSSTVNVAPLINSSTWTRVSGVITPAFGNKPWGLQISVNTDSVYAWGAQLEPGSTMSGYTPTTGTAFATAGNVVTEATGAAIPAATMLGYVAENAATNIAFRSQEFDVAAVWVPGLVAVTANDAAAPAPDGTITADRITDNATAGNHAVQQASIPYTAAAYTASLYVKAGTLPWIQISMYDGSHHWANFNLATGAVGNKAAGVTTSVQTLPNGWFRISITNTMLATAGFYSIFASPTDIASAGPSYVGTGQTMYLWGAQVEQASDPSSYIPTTTVAVTRNGDELQYPMVSNLPGLFAPATTYTECYFPNIPRLNLVLRTTGGSGAPQYYNVTANLLSLAGSGNAVTPNLRSQNAINKQAAAWDTTLSVCLNGGAIGTASALSYVNSGTIAIGCTPGAAGQSIDGFIRNVKFYNVRLTDVEIATLTA